MQNAGLDESQAGIKIARRNTNNLRYTGNSTLMGESEEELKSLLMRVKKESEKAGLKLNIQKTNILASGLITSWQTDGKKLEAVPYFIFLGSKINVNGDYSFEIKRRFLLGRKAMTNLDSMKKQRHPLADKGPYSQNYGSASSHVCTWEVDKEEGWLVKNWDFQFCGAGGDSWESLGQQGYKNRQY